MMFDIAICLAAVIVMAFLLLGLGLLAGWVLRRLDSNHVEWCLLLLLLSAPVRAQTPCYYDITQGAPDADRWTPTDGGFTVYAKINRAQLGRGQAIVAKGNVYDWSLAWTLRIAHGSNLYEFMICDQNQQCISRGDSVPSKNSADNRNLSIIGRWNGGTDNVDVDLNQNSQVLNVFKDGVRIDRQALTHDPWEGIWNNNTPITIGKYGDNDPQPFTGTVLAARFYTGFLSDADIATLSATGNVGQPCEKPPITPTPNVPATQHCYRCTEEVPCPAQ